MGRNLSSNSEPYLFTNFNEVLLEDAGASWYNPKELGGISSRKLDERSFLIDFLGIRRNPLLPLKIKLGKQWGWKDPRNTFTLNYWRKNYFPRARVLHIYRNGIDVALSLKKRNEKLADTARTEELSDFSSCFRLWERYVEQAISLKKNTDIEQLHISYEKLINGDRSTITDLEHFLNAKNIPALINKISVKSSMNKSLESLTEEEILITKQSKMMAALGY